MAIRQKMLGPEHSDTVDSLLVLAMRPAMAEDFSRARPLYERALALTQQVLGPEAPGTNRVRSNLSRILLSAGEPTEAVGLSAAALAAHDNVLGRDHAWTKDSARVTADALDALGRTEEAKTLRERYGLTGPENLEPLSASK